MFQFQSHPKEYGLKIILEAERLPNGYWRVRNAGTPAPEKISTRDRAEIVQGVARELVDVTAMPDGCTERPPRQARRFA